jgi:adenine-specific DNA-methyltransferase
MAAGDTTRPLESWVDRRDTRAVTSCDDTGCMDLVRRLVEWASLQHATPLPKEAVPGTTNDERSSLAAVGGIAAALAGERSATWPKTLCHWAAGCARPPEELTEAILRELEGGTDVLAMLYEAIVSGRNRRRLGTFFTPPPIVDFMLDRAEALLPAPAVVIDPGAGVGAFTLAARRRWPKADVLAVDVNVVTLGLLGARPHADVSLVLEDYLSWAAGPAVPDGTPRLWIGNPPYTRHQELSSSQKQSAGVASGDLVKSGLAGLSAYFLAVTIQALAPEDVLCFLLPGSWTDARYGRPLRAALRDLTTRPIEFYGFGSELDVFPGTRVTAMVLVVGPSQSGSNQRMTTSTARLTSGGVATGRDVARSRLDGAIEGLGGWLWPRKRSVVEDPVILGDVARVRRGVATGANDFFLLTERERGDYPEAATVRAIRRLRHLAGDHLSITAHSELAANGERCWLLQIADPALLTDRSIERWMKAATDAGVPSRYLASHRDPWYLVEAIDPPDVILSPMGKGRMRAVTNEAGALPSNSLYGIYTGGDVTMADRLTSWLNGAAGQTALLERARAYGAGLFKLEPKDVLAIKIPRSVAGEKTQG